MRYDTIADIFSANQKIRDRFFAAVSKITADEAVAEVEGEKWTIAQVVEHVAIVDDGSARICRKLVEAAISAGKPASGGVAVSAGFWDLSAELLERKLEAPERVIPTGKASISDSIERMVQNQQNFEALRSGLESFDLHDHRFPHPYFGALTAAEWLVIAGGHEMRHLRQIERLLEAVRNKKSPRLEGG